MGRTIALATAIAGTLDIAFAMMLASWFGGNIGSMLRYVGSGPLPQASDLGLAGAIIGLVTHYVLIAAMAAFFAWAAGRWPRLLERPAVSGILYGLLLYFVMNWLVVPTRFGTPLPLKAVSIVTQLFAHLILVGLPIALITARARGRSLA